MSGQSLTASLARARREREWFNHSTDPAGIADDSLHVPIDLDRRLEPEMVELAHGVRGQTLCDYGCGWGVVSAFLAQQGARVYSFDISEANIALTRRSARVNGVAGCVFPQVMAAECLAYPDNFFDAVVGNAVLHHLDVGLVAPEIYRVLKPGSRAVFVEPFGGNPLLEWYRRRAWRSKKHRRTEDERSLGSAEVNQLRSVFDRVEVRESRLLRMGWDIFDELGIPQPVTGWRERIYTRLERADNWLLARMPRMRSLCQVVALTLHKAPLAPEPPPGGSRNR
jgi:2-polyprenyl-3-methyl-5-hydroxy-6-metoxy-1,4-benzoquinol methylase